MTDVGHIITVAEAYERSAWRFVNLRFTGDDSRVTEIEHWHGRNTKYWIYTTASPKGFIIHARVKLWYTGELPVIEPVLNPVVDEYYADLALKMRNNWRRALRLPEIGSLEE